MGFLAALLHLLNFVAPALVLALGLAVGGRFMGSKASQMAGWQVQVAINFFLGCAVLLGGLWWFGRDGKLATYAVLVLSCTCCQWVFLRGWRA